MSWRPRKNSSLRATSPLFPPRRRSSSRDDRRGRALRRRDATESIRNRSATPRLPNPRLCLRLPRRRHRDALTTHLSSTSRRRARFRAPRKKNRNPRSRSRSHGRRRNTLPSQTLRTLAWRAVSRSSTTSPRSSRGETRRRAKRSAMPPPRARPLAADAAATSLRGDRAAGAADAAAARLRALRAARAAAQDSADARLAELAGVGGERARRLGAEQRARWLLRRPRRDGAADAVAAAKFGAWPRLATLRNAERREARAASSADASDASEASAHLASVALIRDEPAGDARGRGIRVAGASRRVHLRRPRTSRTSQSSQSSRPGEGEEADVSAVSGALESRLRRVADALFEEQSRCEAHVEVVQSRVGVRLESARAKRMAARGVDADSGERRARRARTRTPTPRRGPTPNSTTTTTWRRVVVSGHFATETSRRRS